MLETKELLEGIKGCNSKSCIIGKRKGKGVDGPCTCPPQALRMVIVKLRHALEDSKPCVGSTRKILNMQREAFLCSLCPNESKESYPGFTQEEAVFWRKEASRFEEAERQAVDKITELKTAMREIYDSLGRHKNGHECGEGTIRPYSRELCSCCSESPWQTIERLGQQLEEASGDNVIESRKCFGDFEEGHKDCLECTLREQCEESEELGEYECFSTFEEGHDACSECLISGRCKEQKEQVEDDE